MEKRKIDLSAQYPDPLLTLNEVATILRRSPEALRQAIRSGRIPLLEALKGGKCLYFRSDLEQLLSNQE